MRTYEIAGNLVTVLSHHAMATIFEIHIAHSDQTYAAQASQEAFSELQIIENDLSRFQEQSDIARINQLKAGQSTVVSPHTFTCLQKANQYFYETDGVFNIGLGNQINRFKKGQNQGEFTAVINHSLAGLILNNQDFTVELAAEEINLDLGGIGKGYAIDYLKNIFDEWDLNCILIQGGRSTALAVNAPDALSGWPISISQPHAPFDQIEVIDLAHGALSSSGVQKGTHIIDPRSYNTELANRAVWVLTPNAIDSDILSTTFLILAHDEIKKFCNTHTDIAYLVLDMHGQVYRQGI
jgi:thiamine biosynthesis lipoprotein